MAKTYLYWDPQEDNIVREYDEAGVVTAEYTTEPDLYGNVISQRRQGEYRQFHYDGQGSTLAVTDENEHVTDTFAYTAFGEVVERTGVTEVPFQYIGQKGYYRLFVHYGVRRRVYSPSSIRWNSRDPMRANVGAFLASYLYCNNRPLRRVDPTGMVAVSIEPASQESMPWIAVRGLHRFGSLQGETITAVTLNCECYIATYRHGLFGRRTTRMCSTRCTLTARIVIYVYVDNILAINSSDDPDFEDIRKDLRERGIPLPTIEGVYGHEQRHVASLLANLHALAHSLSALENPRRCCSCDGIVNGIYQGARQQLCQILEGEKHGTTGYQTNPSSPEDGVDYPPIGDMPGNPGRTASDEPMRPGGSVGGRPVNCSRAEQPELQLPDINF